MKDLDKLRNKHLNSLYNGSIYFACKLMIFISTVHWIENPHQITSEHKIRYNYLNI